MTTYRLRTKDNDLQDAIKALKASFTATVKQAMRAKGIRASKLADDMGITRAYVSKILKGETNITLETMDRFAKALGFKWTLKLSNKKEINPYSDSFVNKSLKNVTLTDISDSDIVVCG
jgi:transcriptional regulator with XRE-family HTH domain